MDKVTYDKETGERGFLQDNWELNDRADKMATKGARAHSSTNTKEKEEKYKLARKIQRCLLREQTRQAPLRLALRRDRLEDYVTKGAETNMEERKRNIRWGNSKPNTLSKRMAT